MGSDRRLLKILHLDPEREWGGGERQVIGLLGYLSRRGHQNHLLCHPDGPLCQRARGDGVVALSLAVRNDLDFRPVLSLKRLLRKERYDIVHFHTKRAHALALWLGRGRAETRYLVTRRMDYPVARNWYNHYLYNRQVDGVVAISQKIADLLVQGGVGNGRIRVIHSGIDPAPFERQQAPRSDCSTVMVGTVAVLEERKGHRFLLEAAALLKRQGRRLRYRFAGAGSQRQRLQQMAAELGVQEDVEWAGFVGDVPGFLSGIDIFVLPSLYEGLGVAVLEAMAAARAVVATRVGGLPEIVEDKVTGLLVPGRDAPALAEAIATLAASENLRGQMGEKGRGRVRDCFTQEQMAKKNEDYYYELLEPRRDGGSRVNEKEVSRVGVQE